MILNLLLAILPVLLFDYGAYRFAGKRSLNYGFKTIVIFNAVGGLAAVLAYFMEAEILARLDLGLEWYTIVTEAFLVTAGIEEVLKLIGGLCFLGRFKKKTGLYIILAFVCIGLGFSLAENVLYSFAHDWRTMVFRSFTAIPSHAIYGILMGALVAKALHDKENKYYLWALGLILPVLIHGIYDWCIIQDYNEWWMLGAPLTLLISGWFCVHVIRWNVQDTSSVK